MENKEYTLLEFYEKYVTIGGLPAILRVGDLELFESVEKCQKENLSMRLFKGCRGTKLISVKN